MNTYIIETKRLRLREIGAQEPELGYFLHKKFWGKGYATEAAGAVAGYAFEWFGYKRVVSAVNPANIPSAAVARRLGMRKEKTSHAHAGGYSWLADIFVHTNGSMDAMGN